MVIFIFSMFLFYLLFSHRGAVRWRIYSDLGRPDFFYHLCEWMRLRASPLDQSCFTNTNFENLMLKQRLAFESFKWLYFLVTLSSHTYMQTNTVSFFSDFAFIIVTCIDCPVWTWQIWYYMKSKSIKAYCAVSWYFLYARFV